MPERTVLLVDDDPDLREALHDVLADEGHDVAEAADGAAALEWLRKNPAPALIFLDWNMAPMNGPAFMREFAKEPAFAEIPVVLLTADAGAPHKATTERFAGYLRKPVDLDTLFETVGRFCA